MNLQSSYVDELLEALESNKYDEISKAAIFNAINKIRVFTKSSYGDQAVKNHFKYLNWKIENYLEDWFFSKSNRRFFSLAPPGAL